MKNIIKQLCFLIIFGNFSCQSKKNNESINSKKLNDTTQVINFKPNGYFNPLGKNIYLNKSYCFNSLAIWLPLENEKPEIFLHFTNNKLHKAINIYFKKYNIKSDEISLSESDTLNGQITFNGKFTKDSEPTEDDAINGTIVLKGDLKIIDKIYKLDFTYFPGD